MRGIGAMLGLDKASDLPITTVMAFGNTPYPNEPTPEPIFPGNHDIVHGQYLYRPDGVDVDLYRFTIDLPDGKEGLFTAETFAERQANSSLLDTVLRLYRENPDGTRVLLSQNDDYFSSDSYLELALGAGTYYVAVSAAGNSNYDPTIEDTGLGGKSQGVYDLQLNFRSEVDDEATIRDRDGDLTPLDGDADGVPGGVYNFWFQTQQLYRTLEITRNYDQMPDQPVITVLNRNNVQRRFQLMRSGSGTLGAGNIPVNLVPGDTAVTIAGKLAAAIKAQTVSGTSFLTDAFQEDLTSPVLTLIGERSVNISLQDNGIQIHGRTIFVDKTAGPNAD
ncbi:MAG: DVUA0089 family protein, partial [Planctomycetales bacterium]|nr:DVUA0089 family protein [Planctomycetales bacterium]